MSPALDTSRNLSALLATATRLTSAPGHTTGILADLTFPSQVLVQVVNTVFAWLGLTADADA